jgi:hypothetical protein
MGSFMGDLSFLDEQIEDARRKVTELQDHRRQVEAEQRVGTWTADQWGGVSVGSPKAPWFALDDSENVPNMLSSEERQYIRWVGQFVAEEANVVELGPWLGQSTICAAAGLPKSADITVVDDFVWREQWMAEFVTPEVSAEIGSFGDFSRLFEENIAAHASDRDFDVRREKIVDYDGNSALPLFTWDDRPLDLVLADCGRTLTVNEAWYQSLRGGFVPGRTLLVMQDWRVHRESPWRWYNQTLLFTEAHADELELVHEVSDDGGLAAFVYNPK